MELLGAVGAVGAVGDVGDVGAVGTRCYSQGVVEAVGVVPCAATACNDSPEPVLVQLEVLLKHRVLFKRVLAATHPHLHPCVRA